MRITVDIDEALLAQVIALTGEKRKSPAVARAVSEFVRRQKAREFGRLIREGAFDYPGPSESLRDGDPGNPVPPLTVPE